VILLENSVESLLPPPLWKEGTQKKKQGLKSKRGETLFEKLHVLKEKNERMRVTSCWKRFYQKKERRSHFSYSAKFDVWPHPYPHIICICTTFYSLTFPFLMPFTTPFSINHDYLPHKLFRIFLCVYNIQGVALVSLESEPPQKY
jgi:hypothetical protein